MSDTLQAELAHSSAQEKTAVGQMLLLALQHGFYLADLPRLAEKYRTSAAVTFSTTGNPHCVHYVTSAGYFNRRFADGEQAKRFAATFDICQHI